MTMETAALEAIPKPELGHGGHLQGGLFRAEDMRKQIELVMFEADRLVSGLEADEQQAQDKTA